MNKPKFETPDMTQKNIDKISQMFPNCITETKDENGNLKKAVNFELLQQMLSEEIADKDEAYEFTWVGKKAAIVEANKPIRKTLRPCKEESVNWDNTENLYIEGDNLEEVKMIYIDPPYNTGHDFVYPDSFIMDNEEYNEGRGYFDNDGDLVSCFNEDVSEDVVKEIARKKSLRAVFRDSSFSNSASKINVFEIFKMISPETSVKVI